MRDDYHTARQSIIPPYRQEPPMDGRLPYARCPKKMADDLKSFAEKHNLNGSVVLRHAIGRFLADVAEAENNDSPT